MSVTQVTEEDAAGALTEEETAELLMLQASVFRVTNGAAKRALQARLPKARERAQDAESAVTAAREAYEPAAAKLGRLQGELADLRQRAANLAAVIDDEDDLTSRLEARSLRIAFEEEDAALRKRITKAQEKLSPLIRANGEAHAEHAQAAAALAELEEAIELPFASELGRETGAYVLFMLYSGWWYLDIESEASRGILTHALRVSGLGEQIQKDGIKALLAGDERLSAYRGELVKAGEAAAARMAQVPPPQPDTTPGADVMAREWAAVAAWRSSQPGLPGVHHQTQLYRG